LSNAVKEGYAGRMLVRFEHRRRTRFFALLRRMAVVFLVFGAVALACGVYVARWSPLFLAGSLLGVGLGVLFLWFIKRTQRFLEGAYLELDDNGLTVCGEGGVKRLGWNRVESAEVVRLGSRLRIRGTEGSELIFPFSESMRKLTGSAQGTATPRDVQSALREHVEVRAAAEEDERPGGGTWKAVDWFLFCMAGFLLLLHMLAAVLMVAPGSRLAQAALLCVALLGALLALRGLALGRAVTAVGVFRGSAARVMGWFGAGGALLALGLVFVV
jgi:hypothetical protein